MTPRERAFPSLGAVGRAKPDEKQAGAPSLDVAAAFANDTLPELLDSIFVAAQGEYMRQWKHIIDAYPGSAGDAYKQNSYLMSCCSALALAAQTVRAGRIYRDQNDAERLAADRGKRIAELERELKAAKAEGASHA